MNTHRPTPGNPKAVTLLEMTIVILVLLSLTGISFMSSKKINEWKLGREAGETLRAVYSAQRLYLADRPTAVVANIQASDIIPYLTNGATSIPTVTSLQGAALTIKVNVSPPVINASGGGTYDPSGGSKDSLWDVGQ